MPRTTTLIAIGLSFLLASNAIAQTPRITVTSPNTRIVVNPTTNPAGTQTIRWTNSNFTGKVDISLSRDGGATWQTLFANITNTGSKTYAFNGTATKKALIRVKNTAAATPTDNSDKSFIIFGPYYKGFPGGYCTEYAARQFDAVAPSPKVNWTGDAGAWYANADTNGWKRTTDPKKAVPGAIVVWSGGGFGHVGVFRSFTKDNANNITHINIQEQNWGLESSDPVDKANAITANWNVITSKQLSITSLNRSTTFTFTGIILPERK